MRTEIKMEEIHRFYKELPIDENNIFTANLAEENEVEEVRFKKSKEYSITGISINQEVEPDLVPIVDLDNQNALSDLLRTYINKKEHPDLDFRIYNEGAFKKIIPFKKSEATNTKYTYYDTATKNQETVEFYDYFDRLEKFGFKWDNAAIQFKYSVKLSSDKKKLTKKKVNGKICKKEVSP